MRIVGPIAEGAVRPANARRRPDSRGPHPGTPPRNDRRGSRSGFRAHAQAQYPHRREAAFSPLILARRAVGPTANRPSPSSRPGRFRPESWRYRNCRHPLPADFTGLHRGNRLSRPAGRLSPSLFRRYDLWRDGFAQTRFASQEGTEMPKNATMGDSSKSDVWIGFDLGGTKMMAIVFDSSFNSWSASGEKPRGTRGFKAALPASLRRLTRRSRRPASNAAACVASVWEVPVRWTSMKA